jgi:hypothetical protein
VVSSVALMMPMFRNSVVSIDIVWFFYPGAVGYLGSTLFVRRIYRNIKCD